MTSQLIKENSVSPDISRLTYFGSASFLFSPIYGKVAVIGGNIINFDIYTAFGMGMTATQECLECLDSSDEKVRRSPRVTRYTPPPTSAVAHGSSSAKTWLFGWRASR